MPPVSLYKLNI
uniref:Uncharacterized protein n=1 Tax=Arundo donax TaxID=35708 RepID=A0A0A9H802_ARUDO